MTRRGDLDLATAAFLQQFGSASIWVGLLILHTHLIPGLRTIGTALLAGASIASVVIGLAAQAPAEISSPGYQSPRLVR
ncbi:MAG TPA: hypothetical protein VGO18_34965 [Steroidobacteraceae bacterium]|jgi:small-conductance mechanosensitive channel|nr:hypothetical protein [Steroidobacteraceae bacterium]